MSNEKKCKTCDHFTPKYSPALPVHGEGYGLCGAHKLRQHIPATQGVFEPAVHEDFGCIDHYAVPSLEESAVNPSDCPRCGFLDSKRIRGDK